MTRFFGFMFGISTPDLMSAAGVSLMVAGMWLVIRWHRDTWTVEEAVKNQKLSAAAARWRRRWLTWRAVALIVTGLGLMVAAIWALDD